MAKRIDKLEPKLDHYLRWLVGCLNRCQGATYVWTGTREGHVFTVFSPDRKAPAIIRHRQSKWGPKYDVWVGAEYTGTHVGEYYLPGAGDTIRQVLDILWRENSLI